MLLLVLFLQTLIVTPLLSERSRSGGRTGDKSGRRKDGTGGKTGTPTFKIQSYLLPQDEARRHATLGFKNNKLYLSGGMGVLSPPNPGFHPRDNTYTLNLNSPEPEWDFLADIPTNADSNINAVAEPWFATGRGLLNINDEFYMACSDARDGKLYSFDEITGVYTNIATIPDVGFDKMEDCCAVGVAFRKSQYNSRSKKSGVDRRIYITGGIQPTGNLATNQVIYYSIDEDKWYQVGSLNTARSHHACVLVPDKDTGTGIGPQIYVLGGNNIDMGFVVYQSIEVYNIFKDKWTQYQELLNPARRSAAAVVVPRENSIIIIGGSSLATGDPGGAAGALSLVQVIDTKKNEINRDVSIPQLNVAREAPAAVINKNDDKSFSIFVTGGRDTSIVHRDTERYDFMSLLNKKKRKEYNDMYRRSSAGVDIDGLINSNDYYQNAPVSFDYSKWSFILVMLIITMNCCFFGKYLVKYIWYKFNFGSNKVQIVKSIDP